jgi:hypothetical protein
MRGYKDYDVKERLARAAEARQKALEKFKARPGPDDPEVIRRRQDREAIAAARAVREAERAERKAKAAAERAQREAKEKAERDREGDPRRRRGGGAQGRARPALRGTQVAADQEVKSRGFTGNPRQYRCR